MHSSEASSAWLILLSRDDPQDLRKRTKKNILTGLRTWNEDRTLVYELRGSSAIEHESVAPIGAKRNENALRIPLCCRR